jgi:hypothetical protein
VNSQVFTARAQIQLHDGLARETVLSDPVILECEKARYRNALNCGEVAAQIRDIASAGAIIRRVLREADDLLKRPAGARRTVCQVLAAFANSRSRQFCRFRKFREISGSSSICGVG